MFDIQGLLGHSRVVRMAGVEPTCDQLPFLVCIRHRGYIRIWGARWELNPYPPHSQCGALTN